MNYYFADMHLFSKNQTCEGRVNHDNRPFATVDEMHAYMFDHWNGKLTNGDTIHLLGDISMRGKNDALISFVSQLKGKKVLIKGNHDDLSDYRYTQLFHEICGFKAISDSFDGRSYKIFMSHCPMLMWPGQHSGVIHCYAHTHNSIEDQFFQETLARMNDVKNGIRRENELPFRAINVGCMKTYMGYEPRTLKEIFTAMPELDFEAQKRRPR